ncbi:MAG: TldD/PmbA family protein [Exilispira sp.]
MLEKLEKLISNIPADYVDIRYENRSDLDIEFFNKDLNRISSNSAGGFVLRVLIDGGFASSTFTNIDDAEKAIKNCIINAKILSKNAPKKVRLAKVEIIQDKYQQELKIDPESISIEDKIELLRKYNEMALSNSKIVSTSMRLFEVKRDRFFVSSEGSQINEKLVTCGISGLITSKKDNILQNVRVAFGGSDGFHNLLNQEQYMENRIKIVCDLLDAQPVKGGVYNVILNQSLAGVFTHEAFGHFSEADIIEDSPVMRQKMSIGAQLGNPILTIIDDPTIEGELGFYKYDDEGVKAKRTILMENGILKGRLHSRATASEFNEPVNGHCVAEDFRYAPIVRMGTIFIENGTDTYESLFEKLYDGLYLCDAKGGQTAGENFTFGAQYGYIVKNGKIDKMVRDINISGNLYETLKNINAIANDLVLSKTGGCGKGQLNIRSCHGAPHILINNLVVGGV